MRSLSTEDFIARSRKIHRAANYDYAHTQYAGSHSKVKIVCSRHGLFEQLASNHLSGKGCPFCRSAKASATRSLKTTDFIARAVKIHGNRYDYSRVNCLGVSNKVEIICKEHGPFWQRPLIHLQKARNGCGCPKCGLKSRAKTRALPADKFSSTARSKYSNRYVYSGYKSLNKPVGITCPEHGTFYQSAWHHLQRGKGCPKCYQKQQGMARRHTPDSFKEKANKKHGGTYNYDLTNYRGVTGKVGIICDKHGLFQQKAKAHLFEGTGCPNCASSGSSGEASLFDWIKSICPEAISRVRSIIGRKELDIVVPSLRIAVEYNGVYWHSFDPLFLKNRFRDYEKWKACKNANYLLLTVWDYDWNEKRPVIEHWLRHKLKASPRICGARETETGQPSTAESKMFFNHYHLQGQPSATVACYGLKFQDQWVAMATLSKSTVMGPPLPEGTYYFSRLALAGSIPGGASKIFKYLVKQTGALRVFAHSDNSYADGDVKNTLGFKAIGTFRPWYRVWHPKYGLRHRSFWQKHKISQRLSELGLKQTFNPNEQTTFEGQHLCGCRQIWDCGKTRWLWEHSSS